MARVQRSSRRLLAPEVVQTSAMDCGPAALKCLLEGFGIPASYARLQEACQTDVDGTSINTIERIAVALGLDAEQVMVPIDHVFLPSTNLLPALVVVQRGGMTHFLIAWQRHGPFVQVMDPAKGRRWLRLGKLAEEIYVHEHQVPARAWREWAGSIEFRRCVSERLRELGLTRTAADTIIDASAADPGWRSLGLLDAATRMVADLVRGGGVERGKAAAGLIDVCVRGAIDECDCHPLVPSQYWSVTPPAESGARDSLVLRGAVLLRVRSAARPAGAADDLTVAPQLPRSLARAITEEPQRPWRHVWQLIRSDGWRTPAALAVALILVTTGVLFEVLLLRGFLEVHNVLSVREHRLAAIGVLLAFVGGLLVLEFAVAAAVLRLGRQLEVRLRALLQEKLPKIGDHYFHSRLVSDMAHRAHSLDALRGLPDLGASLARTAMQLILTAVAIAWIDSASAWIAALAAFLALAIPLVTAPMLGERELRQRSHAAALSRHYLDSLLGQVAARTHGAERALRQRHEALLVEWARSSVHLLRGAVVVEGLQTWIGSMLAVWLVFDFAARGAQPGTTLLLVYWALALPVLGRELAGIVRQFPAYRNIVNRVLEPLGAAEEPSSPPEVAPMADAAGVTVHFDHVRVDVSGHPILENVAFTLGAGEHVAIVGRSGAGKSTLVGLLLGCRTPSGGRVLVDGAPLEGTVLIALRQVTAWVDPAVHLWNRSFFDNLRYSEPQGMISDVGSIVEAAQLSDVLKKLPDVFQSPLGEGGRLMSGGEGQRIRFGRALAGGRNVRLALLDEPFRGLDRNQRRDLLSQARHFWRDATLVCVTHDIEETLQFGRVLVIDRGHIVEDGDPKLLAQTEGSIYGVLLAAEHRVKSQLWAHRAWRRWQLRDGTVEEDSTRERAWTTQHGSRGRSAASPKR